MKTSLTLFTLLLLVLVASRGIAGDKVRSRAPLNPEFVKYQEDLLKIPDAVKDKHRFGDIPSPMEYHFNAASLKSAKNTAFDAVYDLRSAGLVTGVRDQGNCGSCWAFAAYGSLESNWKKNGYGTYDLSEDNMKNCSGFDVGACDGGNRDMATAYLTRFSGPINETVDPYSDTPGTCVSYRPEFYVTNVLFLPSDKNSLKQAILDYGALATNMYFADTAYRASDYTHYYHGTSTSTNHGVTLVGWDDNKVTKSPTPGAWIVKNSWAADWGDNGYFYVSYNDVKINTSPYCLPGRIPTNSSSTLYSIDQLGPMSGVGYGNAISYALIKYTAQNNFPLLKVGTYARSSGSSVSVEIFDTFNEATGTLSGLLGTISAQTCSFPGYYMFSLPSPIPMTSGNDFYVKVRYNTPGTNFPVPIELKINQYADPVIESGVCWTSSDGTDGAGNWEAIGRNVATSRWDLCIKVLTGVSKVWTGGSTSWSVAGNWSPSGVPGTTDDVYIPFNATNQPSISSSSQADCRHLINEGTLTINSDGSLTGSLIIKGKAYGGGNVKFYRQMRSQASYGDYHYFSSPVVETISDFTTANSSKLSQIWEWQETNAVPWQTLSSGSFVSGRGYNLAQKSGSNGLFIFTGSLVNASVPVVATAPYATPYATPYRTPWGGGACNLLGNPYTSALDAAAFISANSTSFDENYLALYIYDGVNNQYQYAASSAPVWPFTGSFGSVVQAGQGFFVLAKQNNVTFTFNPSMQVHGTSVPLKSAQREEAWTGLQLKIRQGDQEHTTAVIYCEKMTAGLDPGYDIGLYSAGREVEIYTALVKDNGVNFTQQALPIDGAENLVVPVGIDSQKGGEVTFSALTRPLPSGTFYLQDKVTGIVTDLGKDSYSVNLPENTSGTGRFYIHASLATGIQPVMPDSEPGIRIWNHGHQVTIEGNVSNKATAGLFDLTGRKIAVFRLGDSFRNTLMVPTSAKGIYLIKVTDGSTLCKQKLVF